MAPRPIDPLPPPQPRVPINAQTWESLSLLHWEVPVDHVQAVLPAGLVADEFEGRSWLGVVPFTMSGVRVPPLPDLGRRSSFPELNLRVYAHDAEGNRGVWFLGLWCSNAGFVASARSLGLPYHRADGHARFARSADGEVLADYRFVSAEGNGEHSEFALTASLRSTGPALAAASGLEAWLTARWNMFAWRAGRLWRYQVHHEPWRLRSALAEGLSCEIPTRFGFDISGAEPLVHVAEPVHTLVSPPRRCRASR